jgi:hypothetical protein
MGSSS